MARYFNVGGPCNAADNYMLPAAERLPEVMSLIHKKQYFVVHAQRQCGKTTAFQSLADEINAKGEMAALYLTVEEVQPFTDPQDGIPGIANQLRSAADVYSSLFGGVTKPEMILATENEDVTTKVRATLHYLATKCAKPLAVFIDEVDCLSEGTLIAFLRQLRSGKITYNNRPGQFPISIALIGMRNIRDYKMRIRPEGLSTGEASPFNVITEAMTLNLFTEAEMRTLYRQHTDETGQVFEEAALKKAWYYSHGQPYLVNALARWCVEKIHHEDFSQPITLDDMKTAKEEIVRERGTHLDSLLEKLKDPRVRRVVEPVLLGERLTMDRLEDDYRYTLDLGLLRELPSGDVVPANPMYADVIGRFLTWPTQFNLRTQIRETPWATETGLDMAGLMAAFQDFWRKNCASCTQVYEYHEATPHLVLMAFLQRVTNGSGRIDREMALGKEALDLGVEFLDHTYAVEVKMLGNYDKSHVGAYRQLASYMDSLGEKEGWLVVFDPDMSKPWDEKISSEDVDHEGKTIHVIRC